LSRGWNRVAGRRGTGCAHDSTFAFRVRPGAPDKILVFLNGGGACWRAQECDPRHPTYTMTADSANDASIRTGIFNFDNAANPVRDFTMVFVPYCTGDVHLGSRLVEYQTKTAGGTARTFSVRHGGAANTESVLDWVYDRYKNPGVVVVTGVDAGAIPSPVVAAKMARHYPSARVVQLGDGAGGYHAKSVPAVLAGWGATEYLQEDELFRSLDSADADFERLYTASATAAPNVRYAQFNTVDDATQLAFLGLLGVKDVPLARTLATNLAEVRAGTPSFHSYVAPGKTHTILRSNAMYATTVGGVAFTSWMASLVNGDEVSDVGTRLLGGAVPAAKAGAKAATKPAPAAKTKAKTVKP
jgi:hypothetical protein